MSQATMTPDCQCLCETPPPSKTAPAAFQLGQLDYALLNSSPVTPHSHPAQGADLRPPTEEETQRYTAMLAGAKRHRAFNTGLIKRTHDVGNSLYLEKRSIIVNWLIDVCRSFCFQPQTLHLAVRHMDWFMALRRLEQRSWQLCAVVAMFLAAKCEEAGSHVPVLDDLKHICENIYDGDSIRCMDLCMLSVLQWDLVVKTPVHFLTHFLAVIGEASKEAKEAGKKKKSLARGKLSLSCSPSAQHGSQSTEQGSGCSIEPDFEDLDDEDYCPSDVSVMDECDCYEDCTCDDRCSDSMDEAHCLEGMDRAGCVDALACEEDMSMDVDVIPEYLSDDDDEDEDADSVEDEHCVLTEVTRSADVVDDLSGIAQCILDASLYEPSLVARFPAHVIAASALSVAIEASGETRVSPSDVCAITNLWEKDMSECRRIMFRHFEETFDKKPPAR